MGSNLTLDFGASSDARSELGPRLVAVLESCPSRKAAWELLRSRGIFPGAIGSFYKLTRDGGWNTLVDSLLGAASDRAVTDAIRSLVDNPPSPPPPRVAVSTLANQFYCEQQVHLDRYHDVRVVSAEMLAGAAGHARFEAEAEPISDAEIARRMESGEAMGLVEMSLDAQRHGLALVGRLDRVQLEGRRARLVLEFKFSGRREVYPSHIVQVEAYGELLAANGFDTSSLVHAVALLPRGRSRSDGLADVLASRALELAASAPWPESRGIAPDDPRVGLPTRRLETADYVLEVFPHDARAADAHLAWAASYWTGAREPVPTSFAGKCRACAFNAAGLCSSARAAPDGRYVSRTIEGRRGGLVHLVASAR